MTMSNICWHRAFSTILPDMWTSLYFKQNRDSSENTTYRHWCVQIYCWTHHWRSFCLWWTVADSLPYWKCNRTLFARHMLSWKWPLSWPKPHDVAAQSIKAMLVWCQCSRLLVMVGIWVLERRSVWIFWKRRFDILWTVMGSRSTPAARVIQ